MKPLPPPVEILAPFPPSSNHYRVPRVGMFAGRPKFLGFALTAEATGYHRSLALLKAAKKIQPIDEGVLGAQYIFYRGLDQNDKLQRGDLMNYEKVLSDALQNVAFRNDSQIREAHLYLRDDPANPRVEVRVWRLP